MVASNAAMAAKVMMTDHLLRPPERRRVPTPLLSSIPENIALGLLASLMPTVRGPETSGNLARAVAERFLAGSRRIPLVHAIGIHRDQASEQELLRVYFSPEFLDRHTETELDLPEEIGGIPVEPVAMPMARITQTSPCSASRQKRQRPYKPGISAGHPQITAGTIGCACRRRDSDGTYLLSNNHVFANVNAASVGDEIWQPGPADDGTAADRIATLAYFTPIVLGGQVGNAMDAALARVDDPGDLDREICTVGAIDGIEEIAEDMAVCKHGRTSGYTEGVVTDESIDALVGMDHDDPSVVALFEDQIRIAATPPYSHIGLGGDSGSLVLERGTRRAVGLYFAGPPNGSYGYANPIGVVMRELNIDALL